MDSIKLTIGEDGVARMYDDEFDVVIHCESEAEQEQLIRKLNRMNWTPTKERLPDDWEDVLVWFEYFRYGDYNCMYSTYGIGNYSNQYDSWLINHETGWTDLHVFAWMPLPKPYSGESE